MGGSSYIYGRPPLVRPTSPHNGPNVELVNGWPFENRKQKVYQYKLTFYMFIYLLNVCFFVKTIASAAAVPCF